MYVKAECEHGCGYSEDNKGWWKKLWTDPIAFFTAILAIFTIGLSFATIRAANAAKSAADALPALERAYVFFNSATSENLQAQGTVSDVKLAAIDEASGIYSVIFSFKNQGRTPAIINSIKMQAAFVEIGFPEEVAGGDLPFPLIIGSGEQPPASSQGLPLKIHDYRKAKAGTGHIFFWGRLIYLDVFGKLHETGICSEWNFSEGRFVFSKCERLNYYT